MSKNPDLKTTAFVYRLIDGDEVIDCVAFPTKWINNKAGHAVAADTIGYSNAAQHGECGRVGSDVLRLVVPMKMALEMKAAAQRGELHFSAHLAACPDLPVKPVVCNTQAFGSLASMLQTVRAQHGKAAARGSK